MPKVSIIMPIYNAEKYLCEAIESVLKQTYTDFELFLINDMSTDNSKQICIEYAKRDRRIVLLENNSETHGPGPTRNIGLDYATGEYIYFMDADDWIDDRLLQCAVHRMQETEADIVGFGIVYEVHDGQNTSKYCWSGKRILLKDEIKRDFSYFWKASSFSLWIYLFRRETVKSIKFENMISGEDISYVLDAFCNAEKIAYISKVLYHYRYVEGSTSRRWNKETIEQRAVIWEHQKQFLKSIGIYLDNSAYSEVAYDNYIWAIYQLSSNLCTLSYKDKKKELFRLEEKMEFNQYRYIYPLELQHGIQWIKYALVKYHLEKVLLFFGPVFLKIVRGE